jgi:cell division protease FtsH
MGVTMYLPTEEKYSETAKGLHIRIRSLLGGRIAEELTFESVTSGASNDLERVTAIARKMVCEWGMSSKIGPLTFGEKDGEVFLGRDMGHVKNYSEATAVDIDNEIRRIVNENYETTRELLKNHQEKLVALSELLLEKETLDSDEILKVVFPDGLPDYLQQQVDKAKAEAKDREEAKDEFTFTGDAAEKADAGGSAAGNAEKPVEGEAEEKKDETPTP